MSGADAGFHDAHIDRAGPIGVPPIGNQSGMGGHAVEQAPAEHERGVERAIRGAGGEQVEMMGRDGGGERRREERGKQEARLQANRARTG